MQIIRSTISTADIQQRITEQYGDFLPGATCLFEYRGVNDIYRFTDGNLHYFFKIYARKDVDETAVAAEVEIVNYLKLSGLSVAYPIPMQNGQYLLPIDAPEGMRYGVLFSDAGGASCDDVGLDAAEIAEIGRLFSSMHMLLDVMPTTPQRWKLDDQLFLDRSIEILAAYNKINHQIDMSFLKSLVKEIKEHIQNNARNWNWGLCHGDMYTGNIHKRHDGNLTIIDFDFCGYGWRAYDISPFLGMFSAGLDEAAADKRKRRLESFLYGYETIGGLSNSEIEAVYKTFVPFRRIFNMGYLYDTLYYVWGNKLRDDLIARDTKLLREWTDYYW
ncbi:MAG: phosphotransferase [Ardenticatenaceae bacterium]|nr:phosphotransferase [Ardenticatenaceae bacterium]